MMNRCVVTATCTWMACLSACVGVSFQDMLATKGTIHLTAWARLRGEFLIYSDARSMNKQLKYPHCISGVFADQAERMKSLTAYDGKLVTLTGELVDYSKLPDEERPMLPRKMLSASVILNACLGPKVLLIKTMDLTSESH